MQQGPFRQIGVSLVEILISLAIGLFILAGVFQLYATTTQNSSMVRGNSSIQEHVRLLFSRIETDVANAGYAGCLNFKSGITRIEDVAVKNTDPIFDMSHFIYGQDNQDVNGKTFDRLVLRYAGNDQKVAVEEVASDRFVVAASQSEHFKQGDIVIAGDCSGIGVFRVSNVPGNTGVIRFEADNINNHAKLTTAFAGKNSVMPSITYLYNRGGAFEYKVDTSIAGKIVSQECSSVNPQYCALYRKSANSAQADELVEGVQAFDVEYGWRDPATGNLFFANAGSVPGATWALIDRIKVTATLSSQNKTPTNEGVEFLEKTFARTFLLFNQIPEV